MRHDTSPKFFKNLVKNATNTDTLRIWYCYEIGSTFIAYNALEERAISLILVCEKLNVKHKVPKTASKAEKLIDKQEILNDKTFGNLIKIMESGEISPEDINYLYFVKSRRDFFIHRFFRRGEWPGDMDADACVFLIRRLLYLQHIFMRASDRLPAMFGRAGLLHVQNLGADGLFLSNLNLAELLNNVGAESE